MTSPAPIGVDTMDVCLSITGPVIELTPEALTQGIIDGTFVINGLSDACEPSTGAAASRYSGSPLVALFVVGLEASTGSGSASGSTVRAATELTMRPVTPSISGNGGRSSMPRDSRLRWL